MWVPGLHSASVSYLGLEAVPGYADKQPGLGTTASDRTLGYAVG